MTNNTGIDFDADVAFMVNDLGDVMTFNGTGYACVISSITKSKTLENAGYFAEASFQIVVQTSLLTAGRPVANNKVTVGGTVYRVLRVETDEADAALNLFCEEVTA